MITEEQLTELRKTPLTRRVALVVDQHEYRERALDGYTVQDFDTRLYQSVDAGWFQGWFHYTLVSKLP